MAINKTYVPVATRYKLADLTGTFKPPKGKRYTKPEQCLETFRLLKLRVDKMKIMGRALTEQSLVLLIRITQEVVECEASIARTMLQPFLHCLMDKRTLDLICWQIAGNRKRLLQEQVHIYNGRKEELGWMSAVVAEHLHDDKNVQGCYRVRVVDGPAAGFDLYMPVPKSLRRMSDMIGATYKVEKERIHLSHPKEAVQMQLLIRPDPVKVSQFSGHTDFSAFKLLAPLDSIAVLKVGAAQKRANAALIKERKNKCPNGYKNACHFCTVGYDACARGCKPHSTPEVPDVVITIKGRNLCPKISKEA